VDTSARQGQCASSSVLSPQSSILSYPLMLPRLMWLVFGEEKSDPEGAICRAKRGLEWGAEV
jgi:hypothetical protein